MAASRLSMRKLRDTLRLHYGGGLSHRAIAQTCAIGLGTVTAYLHRASAAGVTWPVPADLDDVALEARLFARCAPVPGVASEKPLRVATIDVRVASGYALCR